MLIIPVLKKNTAVMVGDVSKLKKIRQFRRHILFSPKRKKLILDLFNNSLLYRNQPFTPGTVVLSLGVPRGIGLTIGH
jgi:hypothetical protein